LELLPARFGEDDDLKRLQYFILAGAKQKYRQRLQDGREQLSHVPIKASQDADQPWHHLLYCALLG
jgi:hypothetical protein